MINTPNKQEVLNIMRQEMATDWQEGCKRVVKSVNFLRAKHKNVGPEEKVPDQWRGIKISDKALGPALPPPRPHTGEAV